MKSTGFESPAAAGRVRSILGRVGLGALAGVVPLLVSLALLPNHRSPYLIAYPLVILSAWLWGLPGSAACALVAAAGIEHYIFGTHQIKMGPTTAGWMSREILFAGGSVLVGFLTRTAALQKRQAETAVLAEQLARADAERREALAKEHTAELRLENEARALMALDGASAGVWEWDIAKDTSKWSTGFYRLHGLEPGGPSNYKVWRDCVHPEDVAGIEVDLTKALAELGSFSSEYRIVTNDGETRWIICEGRSYAGPDGRAASMSGYCGDVTRRKLGELALLRSEKLAVAGRLSAAIAHEVNNPLEAAVNLIYLAQEDTADEASRDYLREALEQLVRVSHITSGTLAFTRTRSRVTQCKAQELVEETLRLLRPKLRQTMVDVTVEGAAKREIACSPGEIQQVLTNLMNNAADAMNGSGGRLRIRMTDSADWRTRAVEGVRISIADNGSGMAKDTVRKIHEPFFTTKDTTGTGLGMWVVQQLLARHGGDLAIRSSQDAARHGTVMSLFFPCAAVQDGTPEQALTVLE